MSEIFSVHEPQSVTYLIRLHLLQEFNRSIFLQEIIDSEKSVKDHRVGWRQIEEWNIRNCDNRGIQPQMVNRTNGG